MGKNKIHFTKNLRVSPQASTDFSNTFTSFRWENGIHKVATENGEKWAKIRQRQFSLSRVRFSPERIVVHRFMKFVNFQRQLRSLDGNAQIVVFTYVSHFFISITFPAMLTFRDIFEKIAILMTGEIEFPTRPSVGKAATLVAFQTVIWTRSLKQWNRPLSVFFNSVGKRELFLPVAFSHWFTDQVQQSLWKKVTDVIGWAARFKRMR